MSDHLRKLRGFLGIKKQLCFEYNASFTFQVICYTVGCCFAQNVLMIKSAIQVTVWLVLDSVGGLLHTDSQLVFTSREKRRWRWFLLLQDFISLENRRFLKRVNHSFLFCFLGDVSHITFSGAELWPGRQRARQPFCLWSASLEKPPARPCPKSCGLIPPKENKI